MKLKELPVSGIYSCWLRIKQLTTSDNPQNCIVSLTSIPERLATLHLTVASILNQSTPPKLTVLWLNNTLKNATPLSLKRLESDRFKICYKDKTYSHRKLIFSLQELQNEVIVTCDDDVMYRKRWLETLMLDHKQYPDSIICHECREISADKAQQLKPYTQWKTIESPSYSSDTLLPIGYGGVLYPPDSLHIDTTNEALFLSLAPKADDLWFKIMGWLNGTKTRKCSKPNKKPIPIIGAKGNSLAISNVSEDGNRKQWTAICEHYHINPCTLKSLKT